jgi:hypothetical protein
MHAKEESMSLAAIPVVTRTMRAIAATCAVAALFAASSVALAQEDLPERVGRVANVAGELFVAPQERPDAWMPAGLNYPVAGGDNLWVGKDGRAEVDVGGTQLRLAGDSNLHVSRLDDRQFALFVAQGRVSIRVRVLDGGETARIDTPNAQVTITRPGLYRVDVTPDREHTRVVVREGEVNVQTASALQQVLPGQVADADGPNPQYATVQNGIGADGFDTWVADRDRYYRVSSSGSYVSPQMVGAADLAQYGSWTQNADYGAVWYPNDVPADWAPYRNGYWVDVGGWGPTWVDYAPWGYAPFHYGRWAYVGGRWGWCPGRYVARPLWAPALVAWTGGAGWGVSVTVGGPVYGWVPLGWAEPYRPWWGRCSHGCWDRYNKPYAVNTAVWRPNSPPPASYRNWHAPNGVTAVSGSSFYSRQPAQQNLVRVSREQVASAPVLASAPPVRAETGRAPFQRPASAPPPASSFRETSARAVQPFASPSSPGVSPATRTPTQASPSSPGVTPVTRTPTQASPSQPSMQREDSRRSPSNVQPASPTQSSMQPPSRFAQPQMHSAPQREAQPQGQMTRPPQPVPAQPQLQPQPVRTQTAQPAPTPQASQPRPAPQPAQQAAPHPAPQAKPASDSGSPGQRSEPRSRDAPQGQDGGGGGNLQRQGR